jgi:hypothetical protein
MSDINCRVAKVEARLDGLCRELTEDKLENNHQYERIVSVLEVLKKDTANNKGFFGGMVFSVGAIFTVITYILGRHW